MLLLVVHIFVFVNVNITPYSMEYFVSHHSLIFNACRAVVSVALAIVRPPPRQSPDSVCPPAPTRPCTCRVGDVQKLLWRHKECFVSQCHLQGREKLHQTGLSAASSAGGSWADLLGRRMAAVAGSRLASSAASASSSRHSGLMVTGGI